MCGLELDFLLLWGGRAWRDRELNGFELGFAHGWACFVFEHSEVNFGVLFLLDLFELEAHSR